MFKDNGKETCLSLWYWFKKNWMELIAGSLTVAALVLSKLYLPDWVNELKHEVDLPYLKTDLRISYALYPKLGIVALGVALITIINKYK